MRCASVNGYNYVFLRDVATYYGMSFHPGKEKTVLRSKYSRLCFEADKREAVLNDVRVNLSLAPSAWNGEPVLSEVDFRRLVDPILRTKALPRADVRRIMLDPGHGGRDPGAAGSRFKEKHLTLEVTKRLTRELRQLGYEVILTRTRDRKLTLDQRVALNRKKRPDLFISLHANFAVADSVKGIETFLFTPRGTPSTYGNSTDKKSQDGNDFDRRNARLAYELQKHMIAATGAVDRGVKHAKFVVLRDASCPAALVEIGFLSNTDEERLLGTVAYQQKIVRGLVSGIRRYHQSLVHKD